MLSVVFVAAHPVAANARVAVAADTAATSSELAVLAGHPDPAVRSAVAQNPATPLKIIKQLAADPDLRSPLPLPLFRWASPPPSPARPHHREPDPAAARVSQVPL